MATRSGRLAKPDSQGQYARQLGWKLNQRGKRVQHKFRLGAEPREAERRDARLRQVWEQIESETGQENCLWGEETLGIAKQVASGADVIALAPHGAEEAPVEYARRLQATQDRFPFLRFVPTDEPHYAQGVGERAYDLADVLLFDDPRRDYFRAQNADSLLRAPLLEPQHTAQERHERSLGNGSVVVMSPNPSESPHGVVDDGKSLHQAMDSYVCWIGEHYYEPELGGISEYGHTKIGQIATLKSRHEDVPLAEVDYDFIESMYRFWRRRPPKNSRRGKSDRISRESVRHYIGELHRFFKWLHRSRDFVWKKPDDFDDIDRSVPLDAEAIKKRIRGVDTFSIDELRLLNRYATPMERLYLLLALNCGFGAKEIATLTIGEVFLHQSLSEREQEIFNFPSTNADSFISLVRNKTTIVGKYLLFQQTVQMLEWLMARRIKQPNPAPGQRLILNSRGEPLDKQSRKGNPSRQIPNSFARLKKRVRDDQNALNDLSFKYLRKTAGDLVRRYSDGEVTSVFLLHGQPVEADKLSDVYTNRPYGKVYDALRHVEEHLRPVFEEASNDPTAEQPQAYTTRRAIDEISDLKRKGESIRHIASTTGKSRSTVHRHIQKLIEKGALEK